MNDAESLAKLFYRYYEELAPGFRDRISLSWAEVPVEYKQRMIAVAEKLLDGHVEIQTKAGED